MAQPTKDEWVGILTDAGVDAAAAAGYADIFVSEKLSWSSIGMLDRGILKELGITVLGDALAILQLAKGTPPSGLVCAKPPAAKLPELHLEMTKQHYRKFEVDWNVFTQMTHLPTPHYNVQLYSCADSEVQTAIINTYPDWVKCDASKLIKMLEGIVTQKSNPMVHRMGFGNLSQAETETIHMWCACGLRPRTAISV